MREKQIGVTLQPYSKQKLAKIAKIQKRSLSAVCAEAIETYLDNCIVQMQMESKTKGTVFSALTKVQEQHKESA